METIQDKAKTWLQNLPITPESNCSYFNDRMSRSKMFKLGGDLPEEFFEILLENGYRRCGDTYYQFCCDTCSLCLSYRVLLSEFIPSKSQKRVLRRNGDTKFIVGIPQMTPYKKELYLRYQDEQHFPEPQHGSNPEISKSQEDQLKAMVFQMYTNPSLSREIEIYLGPTLIGFGILDVGERSVSAVYFVFDPDYAKRSLGTLAILRGIQWAKLKNLSFYYLGFYIPGHSKMDYKRNFRKAQLLHPTTKQWEDPSQVKRTFGNGNF